ncbi:MAG: class I SAM-dependent methyltransferase [Agitococcus sp.]
MTQHLQTESLTSPINNLLLNDTQVIGCGWDFEYATTHDEFEFLQSKELGFLYLKNVPNPSEMAIIYPANYYAFSDDEKQSIIIKYFRELLEKRKVAAYKKIVRSQKANVLDIGCGDGRLLKIIQQHCQADWQFFGIEIGEEGCRAARTKGYEVIHSDIEQADPIEWQEKFDLILMHQLIEHTRYPQALLTKAASWLKPGGVISIETPENAGWDYQIFKKRYWGGYHFPRHFFIFNKKTMQVMAEQVNLDVISKKSILSPVFWIHSVHNYLVEHRYLQKISGFFHFKNVFLLAIATIARSYTTTIN